MSAVVVPLFSGSSLAEINTLLFIVLSRVLILAVNVLLVALNKVLHTLSIR